LPVAPPLSSVPKANGRRPKASRSETLAFLGPPARGNLNPTFNNPDDATAWSTRLELRQPPAGAEDEEDEAERRRARNREYLRRHRAKMTDEARAAARARNREYQRRHLAKKAARLHPRSKDA
jgi:hypothetical protein